MKIGNLDLGHKAILAPMAEITDAPFRKICKENGAGFTFTQMVSAKGVVENSFYTLKMLVYNRSEKPIGVQLLGSEPEYIQKAIHEIISVKPDLIDLNCGCSVPHVCKMGFGASLLDDPKNLGSLVRIMKNASKGIPVSVKIRLGKDRRKINVLEIAKEAEQNGADLIIVHARARSDSYLDKPDWSWIKKVKESISIPVVGNGSLFEAEDCVKMINETGCDSVLIARGALGNPFIFDRLNQILETGKDPGKPDINKIKETALRHLNLQIEDSGEENGVKKVKKYLIWYFKYFNGISYFIEKIFTLHTKELISEFIEEHVQKIEKGIYPNEDIGKIKADFENRVLFWMNKDNNIYGQ